jgi:hypothetical protein
MTNMEAALIRLVAKYGTRVDRGLLEELLRDVSELAHAGVPTGLATHPPFNVPWMDSWVAHWTYQANLRSAENRVPELAALLRGLVDLKFKERLDELQSFVRDRLRDEPPDGGPPEPGTPPAGPARLLDEPPDGGPPEPGTPPVGPARLLDEPPDGGPPEPGTPPTGPDSIFLHDNPWVLYWFVSLKAPMLLDIIDAHMTRRLRDLAALQRRAQS